MPELTKSEKKILAKIKSTMQYALGKKYCFWFIYDDDDKAIDWEGGYDMYDDSKPKPTDDFAVAGNNKFRNQYTIEKDKPVVQNWE
jgi:hypothetical protein